MNLNLVAEVCMDLLTYCQGQRSPLKRSSLFSVNLSVCFPYRVQTGEDNMAASGSPMETECKSELGSSEAFLMRVILCS